MPKLREGRYWAQIVSATTGSSQQGKPRLELSVLVSHVAERGQNDEAVWIELGKGEPRTINLYLTESAIEYTIPKLESIGFGGDFGMPTFTETALALDCTHIEGRKGDGKTFEQWEFAEWGGGGGRGESEPLGADAIRKFNAVWKNTHAKKPPPAGSPPVPTAAPTGGGTSATDPDEIPY